jgi:acyl-CoA thioesterase-1
MTTARFKPIFGVLLALLAIGARGAWAGDLRILAFGTSLTQGYGLPPGAELPVVLQARLRAAGIVATIINAGVSGDTSADGLSRLEWSLADRPDAIILEMGSNDALRGIDPSQTRKNLAAILARLRSAHIPVLLLGMRAPRNLGRDYARSFDAMYPDLARQYDAIFYPFVLDGVALDPKLNEADGIHPNPAGVRIIAEKLLPYVERLVSEARMAKGNR